MTENFIFFIQLLALLSPAAGHNYFKGQCPWLKPMDNFDWKKFSDGRWYATEQFSTSSKCLTFDFIQDSVSNEWTLVKTFVPMGNLLPPLTYRGKITMNSTTMSVKFPLSILGSYSMVVLDTNYDTYGLICFCKTSKVILTFHSISCTILQRMPDIDEGISSKMHLLMRNSVPRENLETHFDFISQKKCAYTDSAKYPDPSETESDSVNGCLLFGICENVGPFNSAPNVTSQYEEEFMSSTSVQPTLRFTGFKTTQPESTTTPKN